MEYILRKCPSCENESGNARAISSLQRAEDVPFESLKEYWSGFFKKKMFFSYARCNVCQLLYCPKFFSDSQLSQLYAHMSDNTAGVSLLSMQKTQDEYFQEMSKYLPSGGNYLEFGPDIGLFTESCVKSGNFDNYFLIEPNKDVWNRLEKTVDGNSFKIFSDLEDIDAVPDNSVSFCVMIHVLDHFLYPQDVINKIMRKLRSGAVLAFVTHDESSMLAKLTKTKWPPYCLQHPQIFKPSTIKQFLANHNVDVIKSIKTRNYFPITYLAQHFLSLFGIRLKNLPEWKKLQIGLRLGNILTIAKKIG